MGVDKEMKQLRVDCMKRDGERCVFCGKGPKYLNLSHILPEEIYEFKYNLDNVLMLCPKCHKLGKFSCHKNPIWFTKMLTKFRPEQYWTALDRLRCLNEY